MKNDVIFTITISAILLTGGIHAENGAEIFKNKGCIECHDQNKDQSSMGLGPSILQIKNAYKSKSELIKFLDGSGQPKINVKMSPIMIAQLATIKALPESSRIAIAEYLMQ